jgi:hypothetical protein
VLGIAASLLRRSELVRVRDGELVSDSRLEQVDDWVQVAGVLRIVGVIVGAACFLRWFHRAYKNLAAMHKTKHRPGWAIGAWIGNRFLITMDTDTIDDFIRFDIASRSSMRSGSRRARA